MKWRAHSCMVRLGLLATMLLNLAVSRAADKTLAQQDAQNDAYLAALGAAAKASTVEEELEHAKRILILAEKAQGVRSDYYTYSLARMATAYEKLGDYAQAESYHLRQYQIIVGMVGLKSKETASMLSTLGDFYDRLGDYEQAETYYNQGLGILNEVTGSEDEKSSADFYKSQIRNQLALFYIKRGSYGKAEQLFLQEYGFSQRTLGTNYGKMKSGIDKNLATVYLLSKDYAKAETLLKQVIVDRQPQAKRFPAGIAAAELNLGWLYTEMGQYSKAEPLYRRSLQGFEQATGTNSPSVGNCLVGLARVHFLMGDFPKAEPLLLRNLKAAEQVSGADSLRTSGALHILALFELERHRNEAALPYARRIRAIAEPQLANLLGFTAERQRIAFQAARRPHDLLATIGSAPDLAQTLLRNKGIVLDSFVEDRRAAEASKDPRIRQLLTSIRAANSRLASPSDTAGIPKLGTAKTSAAERQSLQAYVQSWQQDLARLLTGYGQTHRALSLRITAVQSALPEDAVLLEFAHYRHYLGNDKWEPRYGVVLISHPTVTFKGANPGEPVWVPLGLASAIDDNLQKYGDVMRQGSAGQEVILRTLAKQLIEPVQSRLPKGTRKLFLSPDAKLNFLSFGTLVTGNGKFLAEQFSLSYVTSGRDLLGGAERKPATKTLASFANPLFADRANVLLASRQTAPESNRSVSTDRRNFGAMSLSPLPGTELEAQFLTENTQKWGIQGRHFHGASATEAEVARLQSPYILHLATHGFFLPEIRDDVSPSYLPGTETSVSGSMVRNPMLRSGLALAGAQTTLEAWKRGEVPPAENDGILTAQEVGALNLQNTWLVVLSACDTGIGEARNGEGVLGLRRGFVQAGAQNLLMTLWPISDKWSVDIMKAFYEKAMVTGDAPQAMADVQAEWLGRLRKEKGVLIAARIAGPFVLSTKGRQSTK